MEGNGKLSMETFWKKGFDCAHLLLSNLRLVILLSNGYLYLKLPTPVPMFGRFSKMFDLYI